MNNSKIKVLVFDLGNVLIPFDYNIIINNFNNIEPQLGDKFEKLYTKNYYVHESFEKGEMSVNEFSRIMLTWLDNKIDQEKFCNIFSNIFTLNEELIDLLPKLKKKIPLVLLSNTNHIHQKYGWEKYDFLKHFDKLVLSHEVGYRKPEEGIYKAVENYTGESPDAHLFTDDILEYVEAAKNFGWEAVQFTSTNNYKKVLNERNIL